MKLIPLFLMQNPFKFNGSFVWEKPASLDGHLWSKQAVKLFKMFVLSGVNIQHAQQAQTCVFTINTCKAGQQLTLQIKKKEGATGE